MSSITTFLIATLFAGAVVSKLIFSIGDNSKRPETLGNNTSIKEGRNYHELITPTIVPTNSPSPITTPTPTLAPTPTQTPIPTPTNTATPTPTPAPITAPGILENWFNQYAGQYGVDPQLLKRIAYCESEFNQAAVNGVYVGIFQFNEDIWVRYREEMGHDPNPDLRLDANESIKTAAYLISKGKLFFWPNCH
ncbi:transglycosylase SLT domain-containing protein [Candidatus Woesebacteria bacterium]|nr:transglycosylase SLT domain-containing protein [Candidatus Woesebacteria bacterium]